MAQKARISLRHIQVDKANTLMVIVIAGAAACLIFSLVAVQSLWKQARYNSKVISKKEKTVKQLNSNVKSLGQLKTSYEAFVREPNNIIGGSSVGTGDKDGDNAKITLDAMPSVYDFPGSVSGFNKAFGGLGLKNLQITGIDDEVNQQNNNKPDLVEVPLSISSEGTLSSTAQLLSEFDKSIRPISVKKISFAGNSDGELKTSIDFITYYQPKKKFDVKTEVVK
jgi:hypothetical protein